MKKPDDMPKTWPYWLIEKTSELLLIFNDFEVLRMPKTYTLGGGLTREYTYCKGHLEKLVEYAQIVSRMHVEIEKIQDAEIIAKMPHNHPFFDDLETIGRAADLSRALRDLADKLEAAGRNMKATDGEAAFG